MNLKKITSIAFASIMLFATSCRSESSISEEQPKGKYQDGILMSNEGNYGTPNADVTFMSSDMNSVFQQIYKNNNSENLGDVLQTIGFYGNYSFLVLNNSNKVKVVDRYNFQKVAEITDQLNQPRYITFNNNKVYITNDTKYVNIYDANNLSLIKRLNVVDNAERIVSAGATVFVQNAAWGFGNKLTYFNSSDNTTLSSLTIPNGQIQKTITDNVFVYVVASDSTAADSYIYQISSAGTIVKTITLTGIPKATNLSLDNGKFYFTSGMKIYSMGANSSTVPTTPIVTATESAPYSGLYGFEVIDGRIYTSDAQGFTADSKVTIYDANSGSTLKVITAGRATNGFFKN
ncbi:MAG: hypothetical protein JST62_00285 [Bacteroidetes bacterium]|nr:hypothetical protein [Bacteroidota bacterium]